MLRSMNRRRFHRLFGGLALSGRGLASDLKANPQSGRRVALVIGNATYSNRSVRTLVNSKHDAEDLGSALEKLGFSVSRLFDASLKAMRGAVDQFASNLHEWDDVLFFYAGHGIQIEAENYLVPVDYVQAGGEKEAKSRCFPASEAQDGIKKSNARTNIIVLDACRNNPFRGEAPSATGLALLDPGLGGYIALAASPGQTADENPSERNGLFTKFLLQQIARPDRSISEVFRKVKEQVYSASGRTQKPWLYADVISDFYFREPANVRTPGSAAGDLLESGKRQFEDKHFDEAAKLFEQALRIDPENAFTYNALGATYTQMGQWSVAARLYASAIELKPDYAAAYFNRGVAYHNAGRYELAVQDFSWAVDVEPDDPLALDLRGKSYLSLLEYDRALEDFDHALKINSADYAALLGRGRVFFRRGRFREAVADLSASIGIRRSSEAYELRSQTFRAMGQLDRAEADHQAAMKLQQK
jgi:uncharacterized caspase-like protein